MIEQDIGDRLGLHLGKEKECKNCEDQTSDQTGELVGPFCYKCRYELCDSC